MNSASPEQGATDAGSSINGASHTVTPVTRRNREEHLHAAPVDVSGTASSAGAVVADPDALDRVGSALSELGSVGQVAPLDPSLLSDEVIGHAGLAQALRDFADLWQQRLDELGDHTASIGADLRQAGRHYRDTDISAAQELADLDPSRISGTQG